MLHCRIRTKVQFPNFCASNKKLWGDTEWATNPWPNPVRPHCQAPPRAHRPILWQQLPPTGTSGSAMENLGYLFVCLIDMLNSTNISLLKIVASKVSWSNMPLFKWEIIQPMWNKWFTTRGPPAASDSPLKCSMLICCFSWFELKTKPKKSSVSIITPQKKNKSHIPDVFLSNVWGLSPVGTLAFPKTPAFASFASTVSSM